jgi:hypothetical protein
MKCFYHPDVDAVGTCKNCSRGLCPGSLAEVEDGIACKGRCEAQVAVLNALLARSQRMGRLRPFSLATGVGIGLVMIAGGLFAASQGEGFSYVAISFGLLWLSFSAYSYFATRPEHKRRA